MSELKTLTELAWIYEVEKAIPFLNYPPLYDEIFTPIRQKSLRILEIGVQRGKSLKMWYDYFPNAIIFGYDIARWSKMTRLNRDRVFAFSGDQSKREDLNKFIQMYGGDFDIIIDDGSHYSEHQFVTLGCLFYYLKSNGMYFVEDLQAPDSQLFRNTMREWAGERDWNTNFLFPHEKQNLIEHKSNIRFIDDGDKLLLIEKR